MNERELIAGGQLATCESCGKQFVHYIKGTPPKLCPPCKDKFQARPSIVQSREMLHLFEGVQIESLPAEWQEVPAQHHGDGNHFKMVIKGDQYGASWSGRIDIFASEAFKAGDVVNVREMCSKHLVRVVEKGGYRTFHEGIPYTKKEEIPITETVQPATNPDEANKGDIVKVEDVIRERRYFVFEKSEAKPTYKLVYAIAHTKTTLKGLGRQYWAEANTDACIASWTIDGGMRSGRAHTTGVMAIVNEEHPFYIKKTGDIQGEECYK